MKMQFWSKTTTGKWAAGLTLAFIVLMALKMVGLGASNQTSSTDPRSCLDGSGRFHHGAGSNHQIQG